VKILSAEEIKQRLIRLTNLEHLHLKARERIISLEEENKELKQRIKELENQNKDQNTKIEALSFQFEQIKNKLFGKKSIINRIIHRKEKKDRDIFSYQRPIPKKVTETKLHPVSECTHCHGELKKKWINIFFEENIPLPIKKIVIKHEVEVGYCKSCKKQSSGIFIPSKKTILGDNVRKYVCILSIANRMSHFQIKENIRDIFDIEISIGEIGNILETEANNLRTEYQSLKESVLIQNGTHYDETGWKVQKEEQGKYAWVATGTENFDTIFSLGRSRGKGNIGDIGTGKVGISDDYGAYKNAFEEHQLCWAHPQRKLRDLTESEEFGQRKKKQILKTYQSFSNLYQNIRKKIGDEISPYLKTRFQNLFSQISESHSLDPTPLSKLKTSLRKNKQKYFTFLNHTGIPIDNNKAERALRHLVIKRKISFGSKTQRGAETTSILASVILSLKWNDPKTWFQKYLKLGV
jgi:predicted  nucleic acid-binding Zn-ribbon protein